MLANRTQGRRAVGGSLDLCDGLLVFRPNAFDRALGGEPVDIALAQVVDVGIEPGRLSPMEFFSGGLRSRLRVQLADGTTELFVVRDPDHAAQLLLAAIASESGASDVRFTSDEELIAHAERVGTDGSFEQLRAVVELLDGEVPTEVAAVLVEAASAWAYVGGPIPDEAAAGIVELLRASAAREAESDLARQMEESASAWQERRVQALGYTAFPSWPVELRLLGPDLLQDDEPEALVALADALADESNSQVVEAILGRLFRVREKPREGSTARIHIESVLRALSTPRADAVVQAWNAGMKWRGTPRPDPALPLADRLEEWVWEADERYGIPSADEITRQQVGMFLKMAEELCGMETAEEWTAAADFLEAENFHGLVEGCRDRATRAAGR